VQTWEIFKLGDSELLCVWPEIPRAAVLPSVAELCIPLGSALDPYAVECASLAGWALSGYREVRHALKFEPVVGNGPHGSCPYPVGCYRPKALANSVTLITIEI
jgi:hypothetical protein